MRRLHTERSKELIEQYHAFNEDYPMNHCFEWNRTIVPQLIYARPTCKVSECGHQNKETELVSLGVKNLLGHPEWGFVETMQAIAYDQQFDFGSAFIYGEPTPDWEGDPSMQPFWPTIRRVSPRMYIRDARAPEFGGRPRHEGHMCIAYRDELLNKTNARGEPMYDAKAIEACTAGAGMDQMRQDLTAEGTQVPDDSDIIVFYELYFHDTKTWVTLGWGADESQFLRVTPSRSAYGCPAGGPYVMFGTYPGIDQVYPVPNLAVTKWMVEDINTHRRTIRDDAAKAKRFVVVNAGSDQVIQAISTAPGSSVLSIPGFNGILTEAEIGGPAKESFEYAAFTTEKLDRLSGLTEVARGNVQANTTATAVAQAGSFTDASINHAKRVFIHQTAVSLSKVADLLMHWADVRFPITIEDPNGNGSVRVDFNGGMVDPSPMPWRSRVTVEIEPYSQEYVNQAQLRADMTAFFQGALQIMQAAQMNPAIKPQPMIDDLAQTLNIPQAARKYFNIDMLNAQQALAQMQMGQMAATAMTPPGMLPGGPGGPGGPPGGGPPQQRNQGGPGARHPGLPPGRPGGMVRQTAPMG